MKTLHGLYNFYTKSMNFIIFIWKSYNVYMIYMYLLIFVPKIIPLRNTYGHRDMSIRHRVPTDQQFGSGWRGVCRTSRATLRSQLYCWGAVWDGGWRGREVWSIVYMHWFGQLARTCCHPISCHTELHQCPQACHMRSSTMILTKNASQWRVHKLCTGLRRRFHNSLPGRTHNTNPIYTYLHPLILNNKTNQVPWTYSVN